MAVAKAKRVATRNHMDRLRIPNFSGDYLVEVPPIPEEGVGGPPPQCFNYVRMNAGLKEMCCTPDAERVTRDSTGRSSGPNCVAPV